MLAATGRFDAVRRGDCVGMELGWAIAVWESTARLGLGWNGQIDQFHRTAGLGFDNAGSYGGEDLGTRLGSRLRATGTVAVKEERRP